LGAFFFVKKKMKILPDCPKDTDPEPTDQDNPSDRVARHDH
jgi:hypothetical protein